MKKTLSFLLAFLFCLMTALTACNEESPPITDEPEAAAYLEVIAAGGASSFTVIYPAGDELIADAEKLRDDLNSVYSAKIEAYPDTAEGAATGEATRTDACEILVGSTNRAETAEALQQIDEQGYIITAIGNKLVLTGHNAYATRRALNAFSKAYLAGGKKNGSLRFRYARPQIGVAGTDRAALTEGADLRIMTLNLNCSDNDAKNRYEHILTTVTDYHPDILCFQECNKAQYDNVISKLRDRYEVATTYHKNGSTYVYTPILYLKSKYELVESDADWLRDRYTGTNTKAISFAVLKSKSTDRLFGVINLHGAYCSANYKGYEDKSKSELNAIANTWREGNVRQIIETQTALEEKYGKLPILHTADYNFHSASTPYRMMTEFGLTEAEVSATGNRVTGIKTTHTVGQKAPAGKSIDHIFYNADRITALTHFIGNETESDLRASDHLPVYADISFN